MVEKRSENTERAELKISAEQARGVANLLRYTVGLNTTAGLLSPTERRLATPTYLAVELAARLLEGATFEEAAAALDDTWTGSLEHDHQRALDLVRANREALQNAMSGLVGQQRLARFMEIPEEQFLELIKPATSTTPKENLPKN